MQAPKKPVKPTDEKIAEAAAKRKTITRTEYKSIPAGTIANFNKVVVEFAAKQGVSVDDVRIRGGYRHSLIAKRPETDEEKLARVKGEYMDRYENSMWEYRRKLRRAEEEARQLAALQARVGTNTCCPPNCCCRRGRSSC
jgi:hypothetical protein